jgi:antitoxin VapB
MECRYEAIMSEARAKIFTHGGSQAVRLPKAFRFEGREVAIRRDGPRVILEPVQASSAGLGNLWAEIDALRGGHIFVAPEDPPAEDPI